MNDERQYDVIVVGTGSAGENVADRAVEGGPSAVVVEAELVGGDCSYWTCMPSKSASATRPRAGGSPAGAGTRAAVAGTLDAAAVLQRRDRVASGWDDAGQVS